MLTRSCRRSRRGGHCLSFSLTHEIVVTQRSGAIEVATKPSEFIEFRVVPPRAARADTTADVAPALVAS
jgi:hypothetical protein